MAKILDGIKIIDFTQGHTGSYGTMLLADFGAEVIKIEDHNKGGDVMRASFPKNDKGSAYHAYMNRGKKSICVDRNSAKGQEVIMKLIADADVVCDSFPDGDPTAHGTRMADQFGGVYFAAAVVMALMAREETGEGQQIDVASADCMMTALEDCLSEASLMGVTVHREGNGSRSIAPYDTFEVRDGIFSTAVSTNAQWKKFCEAMEMEELIDDPRYCDNEARGENYYTEDGKTGLRDIIAEKFKDMTRQEIVDLLAPWNIPSGPGFTVQDAFENEQLGIRNMVLEIDDKSIGKIRMPGVPIKISGIDDCDIASAPLLGEDTRELLKSIGYNESEINDMSGENIIMCERSDS